MLRLRERIWGHDEAGTRRSNAKTKAIESLRTAMTAFNSYDDTGRVTTVLMHTQHTQHTFEMLLKAVLVQGKAKVFDKECGKSIGFERCLGLCQSHHDLTADEAGIMRAIDAQRDAA